MKQFSKIPIKALQAACERVKHVDFGYVECDPEQDYHITLPNDGVRFVFCASTQRLKKIEIYDMKLCALRYGEIYFNSSSGLGIIFNTSEKSWLLLKTLKSFKQCQKHKIVFTIFVIFSTL